MCIYIYVYICVYRSVSSFISINVLQYLYTDIHVYNIKINGYTFKKVVSHYFFSFLFYLPATPSGMWGQFPDQESNLHLLHWKHRVLTTGPPGKTVLFKFVFLYQ